MYSDDPQTTLEELTSLPQCDVGAPLPQVVANDYRLLLAYLPRQEDSEASTEAYSVVRFSGPQAHFFGPPNDEAISGHPLYSKGLEPYACYRVVNSSWIRSLERMNSVHPMHKAERYDRLSHYIFTFHDSTFECVADSFEVHLFHTMEAFVAEIEREFWSNG
jgi:hypothetical protein